MPKSRDKGPRKRALPDDDNNNNNNNNTRKQRKITSRGKKKDLGPVDSEPELLDDAASAGFNSSSDDDDDSDGDDDDPSVKDKSVSLFGVFLLHSYLLTPYTTETHA